MHVICFCQSDWLIACSFSGSIPKTCTNMQGNMMDSRCAYFFNRVYISLIKEMVGKVQKIFVCTVYVAGPFYDTLIVSDINMEGWIVHWQSENDSLYKKVQNMHTSVQAAIPLHVVLLHWNHSTYSIKLEFYVFQSSSTKSQDKNKKGSERRNLYEGNLSI